jgi:hypothetical protein
LPEKPTLRSKAVRRVKKSNGQVPVDKVAIQ